MLVPSVSGGRGLNKCSGVTGPLGLGDGVGGHDAVNCFLETLPERILNFMTNVSYLLDHFNNITAY